MRNQTATLTDPPGPQEFEQVWAIEQSRDRYPVSFGFSFGGNKVYAISPNWDELNFRTAFQIAVHRIKPACKVHWETPGLRFFTGPKAQRLQQRGEMGCGVAVFGELTGISREQILSDHPTAEEQGLTVNEWKSYLEVKGFEVCIYDHESSYPPCPCAHLMQRWEGSNVHHWIYQDEEGDILDPDPAESCVRPFDPRLLPADDPRLPSSALRIYDGRTLSVVVARVRES